MAENANDIARADGWRNENGHLRLLPPPPLGKIA